MSRTARASRGGVCYHVMNRGNNRSTVFHNESDYDAFERLLAAAKARTPMRVLAWCLMPNHFHLVLHPYEDGDLSRWMHWLLTAHVQRHRRRHETIGRIWQGRFQAPPIERDRHLLIVMRYVERNPVRANLVESAKKWTWSSLCRRISVDCRLLSRSPVDLPDDWPEFVDEPLTASELASVRESLRRGSPYGSAEWICRTARSMGIQGTLRPRGRPARTIDD